MTTWLEEIQEIVINEVDKNHFTLNDIYQHKDNLKNKFPANNTIKYSIRKTLYILRDLNKLVHLNHTGSFIKTRHLYEAQDIQEIKTETIRETTRQTLIEARLGQGDFRKDLLHEFKESCIVSKAELFLVASHIKPWRYSDNKERLNSKNGLLLSRHLDAFFDAGCVTFDKNGVLIKSNNISDIECERYGIKKFINEKIYDFCEMRQNYLEYHRDCVFNK
jgi:hypothetical protein